MTPLFLYSVTHRENSISGVRKIRFYAEEQVTQMLQDMKTLEVMNLNPIMRIEIVAIKD